MMSLICCGLMPSSRATSEAVHLRIFGSAAIAFTILVVSAFPASRFFPSSAAANANCLVTDQLYCNMRSRVNTIFLLTTAKNGRMYVGNVIQLRDTHQARQ